jgi:hypothetical protein
MLVTLAGCRGSAIAHAQWDYRVNNMKYPLERFAAEEARRPGKLDAAGKWIESSIELDRQRTRHNPYAVEAWFQRDVERMRTRDYDRGFRTFFGGQPERIAPNAIKLFF